MRPEVRTKDKILYLVFCLILLSGCATPLSKLPPPPPKYIYQDKEVAQPTNNSIWRDTASLYEDKKARRLNDLVTIIVSESIKGSGKADTDTKRKSTVDVGVDKLLGVPLNLNMQNLYGKGNTFSPEVKGSATGEFKGSGETNREGKLIGTLTARVVDVMPNGNLVLEGRKEIMINNEKQIFILKGIAKPEDISGDNTILSNKIADAQVYFVGDGVIQERQRPGWLVRILDKVWPF